MPMQANKRWWSVALVLAATMAASGCGARSGTHAVFSASPATALFDAPVSVSISGLPPGAITTVTATAMDHTG